MQDAKAAAEVADTQNLKGVITSCCHWSTRGSDSAPHMNFLPDTEKLKENGGWEWHLNCKSGEIRTGIFGVRAPCNNQAVNCLQSAAATSQACNAPS